MSAMQAIAAAELARRLTVAAAFGAVILGVHATLAKPEPLPECMRLPETQIKASEVRA